MSYTIIAAVYANADHTSAVVTTAEVGNVALSQDDMPDEWSALLASDVPIAQYVQPVPASVSAYQVKAALMNGGLYAQAGNAAATAGGLTLLAWQTASEFQRRSPAIAGLAATLGLSDAQVDELFISASIIVA